MPNTTNHGNKNAGSDVGASETGGEGNFPYQS